MRKKFLKLGLVTLFIMFFALLMPKVTFASSIEKIEITVPEPVIGKPLTTDASKIQIKSDDGESFLIDDISWLCSEYSTSTNQYLEFKEVIDYSKACNNIDKYQLLVSFLVPNTYVPSSNIVITVNGTEINTKSVEELNWGVYGDTNNDGVFVCFEFGNAKVQKEISKIEITSPTPVVGEKLTTDISKFEVKIDDAEILNITNVEWLSEDFKTFSTDIAEAGKKYNVRIDFNIPNKYALSSDIIVTVNGEQIDVNNINEFYYGFAGDLNFDYTNVHKLMEVKDASKEEPKENLTEQPKEESKENLTEQPKEESKENLTEQPKEESKEEIIGENATEEIKTNETVKETTNPKTGDTITKSFFIFIIAVAGIALTIISIKKQNK